MPDSPNDSPNDSSKDSANTWRDDQGRLHIDVRGLPAPEPLLATLRLLVSLQPPEPVVFHHDRDPQLLYAELAELGWHSRPEAAPAGEVRLSLLPGPSPDDASP